MARQTEFTWLIFLRIHAFVLEQCNEHYTTRKQLLQTALNNVWMHSMKSWYYREYISQQFAYSGNTQKAQTGPFAVKQERIRTPEILSVHPLGFVGLLHKLQLAVRLGEATSSLLINISSQQRLLLHWLKESFNKQARLSLLWAKLEGLASDSGPHWRHQHIRNAWTDWTVWLEMIFVITAKRTFNIQRTEGQRLWGRLWQIYFQQLQKNSIYIKKRQLRLFYVVSCSCVSLFCCFLQVSKKLRRSLKNVIEMTQQAEREMTRDRQSV